MGGTSTLFLEWAPSTNTNIFSHFNAHLGEMLNISHTLKFLTVLDICQHMSAYVQHMSNICSSSCKPMFTLCKHMYIIHSGTLPTQVCSICTVTVENMNAEAAYILKNHAGIPDVENYLQSSRQKSIRVSEKFQYTKSYREMYATVSKENIDLLRDMFKRDIYVFGYPETPFVDFDRS